MRRSRSSSMTTATTQPSPGISRSIGAPRHGGRWRHGHDALLARRFHQPLLRRTESLGRRHGAADPPGVRQGRRGDPRNQHVRRNPAAAGRFRHGGETARHQPAPRCGWRGKRPRTARSSPARSDRWACASSRSVRRPSPKPAKPFREQIEALVEAGVDLLIMETFGNLDELREAVCAAREVAGHRYGGDRAGHDRRFRASSGRHRHRDVHARNGFLAGGRDRAELLRGAQGHARNHRAHDAGLHQADERHAERRPADADRGPQHLSVLARVHGAVRAAAAVGGGQDHRRLLRHHAGPHQADPLGDAVAAAGAEEAGSDGGGAAGQSAGADAGSGRRRNRSSGRNSPPGSSSRLSRFCRRAASMLRARSTARAAAARRESTASTCPTGRAPAPA